MLGEGQSQGWLGEGQGWVKGEDEARVGEGRSW